MGLGSSLKKAFNATSPLGNNFLGSSRNGLGGNSGILGSDSKKADGTPYTPEEITTANLFKNLSTEQQKDLLLNNPNIYTPQGSQTYDPLTNSVNLNESEFTKSQRMRQESLASQLSGSLSGNLPSSNEEIQNATFNRGKALIDPIVKQQKRDLAQQLADQGIPMGSEGYNEAMNRLDDSVARQYTDLSQASIQTAETQRAARFNEIASLLGTAQVGGVGFNQFQPQFSGLDLFGAEQQGIQNQFTSGLLSKQLKQQNKNAQYQALGTLGGAGIGAIAASDPALKENVEKVGEENGFNIYEFNYKKTPERRYKGVMADEVQKIKPEAVIRGEDGFLMVDYSMIGLEMLEVVN